MSACVAAGAIVVTKNKRATEIASRGIAVRSLSRRASRRATPTDTRRPVSKVRRVRQRSRISPEHLGGGGHCQGAESTAASADGDPVVVAVTSVTTRSGARRRKASGTVINAATGT